VRPAPSGWSGTLLDAVRGRCATMSSWNSGSTATTALTKVGGPGGGLRELRCDRGYFNDRLDHPVGRRGRWHSTDLS
jgi:hypothetical protein